MKRHWLLLMVGALLCTGALLTGCGESSGGGDKMATSEGKMSAMDPMADGKMAEGKMDGGKMETGKMDGGKMDSGK
jgi:uncharacterized protein involved in copper resistance